VLKTRVNEMLGVRYPILLAPMGLISKPELVSAVSDAGGLGMLSAAFISPSEVREQIKRTRELTDAPFGVNVPIAISKADEVVDILIQEEVSVVFTSAGSPKILLEKIRGADMVHLHMVPTARIAKKVEQMGVDMLVAQGGEAGGIVSENAVTTMALIPQVVDAVSIPVIAAGGIADGRGLVAALALGAEGILMGTRFICSKEAPVSEDYKRAVIESKDDNTVVAKIGTLSSRVWRNKYVNERGGVIDPMEQMNLMRKAIQEGDLDNAVYIMGMSSGMIREIKSAEEIINSIVDEAQKLAKNLANKF